MTDGRRFLRWLFGVLVGAWCVGAAIHVFCPTPDLRWGGSALPRELLAERTHIHRPARRMLLAGGSGTLYGVSAEAVEDATGIFTQNIGAHAGLGMLGTAWIVSRAARADDWVVLAPEYGMMDAREGLGGLTVPFLARERSLFFMLGGPTDLARRTLLLGSPGVAVALSGVATRLGFEPPQEIAERTRWGDLKAFPRSPRRLPSVSVGTPTSRSVEIVRRLTADLRARGVRVTFLLPLAHVDATAMPLALRGARAYHDALESIGPVLDTGGALELSADKSDFSNTPYHASSSGRRARTARIIAALRAHGAGQ